MKRRIALLMVLAMATTALPVSAFLFGTKVETEPATITTFAKNSTANQVISFAPDDFLVTGSDSTLDTIVIETLPDTATGALALSGMPVAIGTAVSASSLGNLSFLPATTPTAATTQFCFTPVFSDGSAGDSTSVDIHLLSAKNNPPIAENLTFCTYRDVPYTGQLSGTDPEGDLLTFRLVKKPSRGSVDLTGETGQFVYTPYEGKTGKDSFTFVAVDALGNLSETAKVTLTIEKADTKVTYADMYGNAAYKSALRLAEEGLLIGESMGDTYFFQPDAPISRAQFVALAMDTVGLDELQGIVQTGFADDAAIETWAKGYITSALKSGIVQGTTSADGIIFDPARTITKAEATVLLDRLLSVSDTAATTHFTDVETTPTWAYQAAVNLESVNVIATDTQGALGLNQDLTRGDAAMMLEGALEVLEAREETGWFHW